MPNRLASEASPYLRDHAENPVDWHPWGDEALDRAKTEDKPIFLSIGYSACHWCHVMARESFSDPKIAEILNANYVNIKVDREERPDVDEVYIEAVRILTGSAGWPLSVFLTPELKPFYGGTYFPPDGKYGRPGFRSVLDQVLNDPARKPDWPIDNALNNVPIYTRSVPQRANRVPYIGICGWGLESECFEALLAVRPGQTLPALETSAGFSAKSAQIREIRCPCTRCLIPCPFVLTRFFSWIAPSKSPVAASVRVS